MFDVFIVAVSVTLPIFAWILMGVILKSLTLINDRWVGLLSKLVFYVSLPALMFFSVIRKPISEVFDFWLTAICVAVTLIVYFCSFLWSRKANFSSADSAVIQQGALRGNLGIIGISLCFNAYGSEVLVKASVLMALLTIAYNLLSVYAFVSELSDGRLSKKVLLASIAKNPLIVAVAAGLPLALAGVEAPAAILTVVDNFVAVTLPLALVSIGASLSFRAVVKDVTRLSQVALLKLICAPVLGVLACLLLGYRGADLGVVFLLLASPTATASFIMAKAYSGNHLLAANIVVYTTLSSLLSISVGVFLLTFFKLM